MAFSKQHLYNPVDQITGSYAHAFSHPARILIIKQLLISGPTVVQVIARDHPIHKESISDHMKILRHLDLIEGIEKYPYTFYDVNIENLKSAVKYLSEFLEMIMAKD